LLVAAWPGDAERRVNRERGVDPRELLRTGSGRRWWRRVATALERAHTRWSTPIVARSIARRHALFLLVRLPDAPGRYASRARDLELAGAERAGLVEAAVRWGYSDRCGCCCGSSGREAQCPRQHVWSSGAAVAEGATGGVAEVAVGHKRRVPVVRLLKAGEDQSNFAKPSLFDSVLFVQDQWFCSPMGNGKKHGGSSCGGRKGVFRAPFLAHNRHVRSGSCSWPAARRRRVRHHPTSPQSHVRAHPDGRGPARGSPAPGAPPRPLGRVHQGVCHTESARVDAFSAPDLTGLIGSN
jgi:hypothetical protein